MKDSSEGQTHYENDGCGEPEHNKLSSHMNDILARFDLLWGIAPPDSLKGKKGAEIKQFIVEVLAAQEKETLAILDSYSSVAAQYKGDQTHSKIFFILEEIKNKIKSPTT